MECPVFGNTQTLCDWKSYPFVFLAQPRMSIGASMILGLLKLWTSSKAPPMDMDPPIPCPMIPIMIYSSMHVLGMIKLKRPI